MTGNHRDTLGTAKAIGSGWPTGSLSGFTSGEFISLIRSANLGSDDSLSDPYLQHIWVYACVKKRAETISSVPFKLWATDADDAAEITRGPLVDVFEQPHPLIGGTRLWALTSIYRDLYGECFWLLHQRRGGEIVPFDAGLGDRISAPVEITPVPGSSITIDWDERTALPRTFWYSATREGKTAYPPGSVLPFIDLGPGNPLRGTSSAEALRRRLEADFHAESLDMRATKNGGRPSVWLSTPEILAEPQIDQFEARLEARQNSPDRHNKPALLHGGLTLQDPGWSPRDMENLEMRKWSREAIMAVFGVTKPILGIVEDVNRANAQEAKAVFWEETILPLQASLARTVREGLLSRCTEGGGRFSCGFDTTGVEALGESLDDKIARTKELVALGVSFNKAAELSGWEIDPLGDEDLGVVEVEGQAAGANAGQGEEAARPELTLNGAQIASLLSIIEQVAAGTLPKETGIKVIVASFPFDEARAREILADIVEGSKEPEPVVAPPVPELEPEIDAEPVEPEDRAIRAPRTSNARQEYARAFAGWVSRREAKIKGAVLPVQERFLEAVQTKLRQVPERAFRPKRPEIRAVGDELPPEVLSELERLVIPSVEAWAERMGAAIGPVLAETYFDAVAEMARELGTSKLVPSTDAVSLAYLAEKEIRVAEGVMSTLAEDVKQTIARTMLEDGPFTIAEMSDRILERMEELGDAVDEKVAQLPVRADRIARTEASAVANRAKVAEMILAGVEQHMWTHLPSPDERTNHAALDGKVVRIGEEFAPGLRLPKDDRAPASEVINCGCTVAPMSDDIADLIDPLEDL